MVDELQKYAASGGHLVTFDVPSDFECDQVIFDRADSADQAVTHLLELGHRDIGFAMPGVHSNTVRTNGMRDALKRYGLSVQKDLLFDSAEGLPYEIVGGELARLFLENKRRPSALCIPDDTVAASFIAELYRHGMHVPEDLSVVSHDDLPIAAHNFVPITTVAQPLQAIAKATSELLMSRLDGSYDGPPRTVRLCGELIIRQSTAAFAAK